MRPLTETDDLIADRRTTIMPGDHVAVICGDHTSKIRWLEPGTYEVGQTIREALHV